MEIARHHLIVVVTGVVLVSASPLLAQESLTDTLSFLVTNQAVPTGDFVKDAESAQVTSETIRRLLLAELTMIPLSSSSGGFAYHLNPLLGTAERASESFGPFFTERSLTVGSGRISLGAQAQIARFSRLDGHDLRDGTFVTTANQFRDEAAPFDVETLSLAVDSATVTAFGTVGLHDRVDLGVAVPFVWLSLEGSRLNVYRGSQFLQARATAEAAGFGDVSVRGKVNLLGMRGSGLAVIEDVRLPTGREEDLLGAGEASFRTVLIASSERGRVGVHGNFAVTAGGVADGVDYRAAVTVSPLPQLTIVGELIGRHIADLGRLTEERVPHPLLSGVDTLRLIAAPGSADIASLVAGTKWNVSDTWLLNVNVSLPLTERGLHSDVLFLFGLDYTFEP